MSLRSNMSPNPRDFPKDQVQPHSDLLRSELSDRAEFDARTRHQQLKDSTDIYNSETTESFLRQYEGRLLPGWTSYRNVVHTDRWKKHFAGSSLEDPRPICGVECPQCGADAWTQCRQSIGKPLKPNHAARATAAMYGRTTGVD